MARVIAVSDIDGKVNKKYLMEAEDIYIYESPSNNGNYVVENCNVDEYQQHEIRVDGQHYLIID